MHWIWHGCSLLQKIRFGQPVCRLLRLECTSLKKNVQQCATAQSNQVPGPPASNLRWANPGAQAIRCKPDLNVLEGICAVSAFFCFKTQTLGLRSCSLINMFSYECLCKDLGGIYQDSRCWLHLLDLHETVVCDVTQDTSFMKQPTYICKSIAC